MSASKDLIYSECWPLPEPRGAHHLQPEMPQSSKQISAKDLEVLYKQPLILKPSLGARPVIIQLTIYLWNSLCPFPQPGDEER